MKTFDEVFLEIFGKPEEENEINETEEAEGDERSQQ